MIHTYTNKNEEQPEGFAGSRIFKEYYDRKTINSYKDISVCNVLFWSSCLNMHSWQHLTMYFGKSK